MLHGSAVKIWQTVGHAKKPFETPLLYVIEEWIRTAKEPEQSIPTSKDVQVKEYIDDGIMQNLLHLVPRLHIRM